MESKNTTELMASALALFEALKVMTNLAEYGVEKCAENSRPEERPGHEDGLRAEIAKAKELIEKLK